MTPFSWQATADHFQPAPPERGTDAWHGGLEVRGGTAVIGVSADESACAEPEAEAGRSDSGMAQ